MYYIKFNILYYIKFNFIYTYDIKFNMETKDYVHTRVMETPGLAKSYTHDCRGNLRDTRWIFIKLKKYVDDFLSGTSENRYVVVSGLRGIGKTTAVLQVYEYLKDVKGIDLQKLFYFSVNDIKALLGCKLSDVLRSYIEDELKTSVISLKDKVFIFVDEAHFDKDWDNTIKAFYDNSKKIFFLVTGSSALLLESSTDSTRRRNKEPMFPLSFSEYQMLKYSKRFYPPQGMSKTVRDVIINGYDEIGSLKHLETILKQRYTALNISTNQELDNYLRSGGFAFGVELQERDIFAKTMDMIDRMIKDDLPAVRVFETSTLSNVFRILGYIALKKPGDISQSKLAKSFDRMSPDTISNILEALEKTQTIFSVKPKPNGSKSWAGTPWRYYFLTPTMQYALRYSIGKSDFSSETRGCLFETMVASTLFRISRTISRPIDVFYDKDEGGVDFLLYNSIDNSIVPIEIGLNKDTTQIRNSITKYDSKYGILISNFEHTEIIDKIIKMPIGTFAFA